jgi:ribosomal subunit interface protein
MWIYRFIVAFWRYFRNRALLAAVCYNPVASFPPHSMQIEHFEKGVRYTDKELLQVAKKIGKMATYCSRLKDEASVIRIEAEHLPTKKKADEVHVMVTVELPGKVLYADSRKKQVLEAFDRAVEKLEPQLLRYKELHTGKQHARIENRKRSSRSLAA